MGFQCGSPPVHAISCVSWEENARAYHHALPVDGFTLLVNITVTNINSAMFRQFMAAVGLVTVKSWTKELAPNRKWLRYETQMVNGKDTVTKVTCEVCQNHQSRLRQYGHCRTSAERSLMGSSTVRSRKTRL